MIRYDEHDEENKYGATQRMIDIFEMAKRDEKPDESFTEEELEFYEECADDFKWCDENGRSRDTVVMWYDE